MRLRLLFHSLPVALVLAPTLALAATLQIQPATASVTVGDTVTVTVFISSSDQAMNAVSGTLSFPADLLQVASISKANSALTLWVQDPSFSNTTGGVEFSGVVPNPGFIGDSGRIIAIRLRAIKAGIAPITFVQSSVLANDGNGTNILTTASPSAISIITASSVGLPISIRSPTHPDENAWYPKTEVGLNLINPPKTTAVRILYDKYSNSVPTVLYTPPITEKTITLGDGVWYFHAQAKTDAGWGKTVHFAIHIDTKPPSPVIIRFPEGATTTNARLAVEFNATDTLSGIDHYDIALGGTVVAHARSGEGGRPYILPLERPGPAALSITAYDRAGNSSSGQASFEYQGAISRGAIPTYLLILLALLIELFVLILLWYAFRRTRRRTFGSMSRAHAILHRQFIELKDIVASEVHALENIQSKRKLTLEEERLVSRLKKAIDRTEYDIEREIDHALR